MNKIELTEEQVRETFKDAKSDETVGMLQNPFPGVVDKQEKKKPTLGDYTSITSYEDACEALGESTWLSRCDGCAYDENSGYIMYFPPHIIALMKLESISRALWGRI